MDRVETYVRGNYKKLFGDKPLLIVEYDTYFTVRVNKDASPLILSKDILNA